MTDGFPASLWPGSPIPDAPVIRGQGVVTNEGGVHWSGKPWTWALIPPELALRELLNLDTASSEGVMSFMNTHGAVADRPREDGRGDWPPVSTIGAAQWLLGETQQIVRHWVAFMADDFVAPIWYQADRLIDRDRKRVTNDEAGAWMHFAGHLNDGLVPFHAHVTVRSSHMRLEVGGPQVDLVSALCLQVYNLAVEGLPPKRCQNETCGQLFIRQRGGAKAGQYRRTGVQYCTPNCARAQGQRERRRSARVGVES